MVWCWPLDQMVVSSIPGRVTIYLFKIEIVHKSTQKYKVATLGKLFTPMCVSVTNQYKLKVNVNVPIVNIALTALRP